MKFETTWSVIWSLPRTSDCSAKPLDLKMQRSFWCILKALSLLVGLEDTSRLHVLSANSVQAQEPANKELAAFTQCQSEINLCNLTSGDCLLSNQ